MTTINSSLEISFLLSSNPFLGRLFSSLEQGRLYENVVLQEKARRIIPLDELKSRTRRNYNFAIDDDDQNDQFRDFLLLELLNWFKNEFFTWLDKPECGRCGSKTAFHSNVEANVDEKLALANRIENYICENERCSNFTRFPRFNDPGKLLETKTGRCGEWANCFTLCARSLGYEVR
uniref:Transglutaminase-like domain-containing protein n=1 Tax=Romanomermis culicivorax TaxID=13658 RepID=A0A915JRZ1_ROMCU